VKITKVLVISIIILGIFGIINNVRAYVIPYYFEMEKEIYYTDENIKANASWELEYGIGETAYIQLQIFNETDDMVWYSPLYTEKGVIEKEWDIPIQDFDTPFNNYSNNFYSRLLYFFDYEEAYMFLTYFRVLKRNTSCQIVDCPREIGYGEILQFRAIFYNISLDNETYLVDYLINFRVISNETIIYQRELTTNSSGMIEVIVPADNLSIGINFLVFEISNNKFYNDLIYEQTIYVNLGSDERISTKDESSKQNKKQINSLQLSIISIVSILSILLFILTFIIYRNSKRTKPQNLVELSIRY